MHTEGDGKKVLELFMRPVEKALRELKADIRLAGCQHLHFTSARTSVATDVLQGPQQISIFQLAKYKLGKALFQCQLCSTLMAHISRKGFLFDLFSISVCISYLNNDSDRSVTSNLKSYSWHPLAL